MKQKILISLYLIILTVIASLIAYESWGNAIGYSNTVNKITQKLQIEDNLKNSGKKFLEKISFNLYDGYTQSINQIKKLKKHSEKYDKNAYRFTKAFMGVVLLSLFLFIIARKRVLVGGLLVLSVVALVTGWFAPILEITAYQDIPVLGNTIFQYESKSIMTALTKIYHKQQYAIAIIIVLFTIITPILKTLILLAMNFKQSLHLSSKSVAVLSTIGKWSMLDVFVVAIVVTYFSMKSTGQTDANLQIGVYYFTIYVLLSMICTFILTRKTKPV